MRIDRIRATRITDQHSGKDKDRVVSRPFRLHKPSQFERQVSFDVLQGPFKSTSFTELDSVLADEIDCRPIVG